ncbi:MAG: methyl-accepting chemotaxis protein [Pseudomonadota bacterium]
MSSTSPRSLFPLAPVALAALIAVCAAAVVPGALIAMAIGFGLVLTGTAVSALMVGRLAASDLADPIGQDVDDHPSASEASLGGPTEAVSADEPVRETLNFVGLEVPCFLVKRNGSVSQISRGFDVFADTQGAALQLPRRGHAAAEELLQRARFRSDTSGSLQVTCHGRDLTVLALPLPGYGTLAVVIEEHQKRDSGSAMTVRLTAGGQIVEASPAFAAAIGRAPEDLVQTSISSHAPSGRSKDEAITQNHRGLVLDIATPGGEVRRLALAFDSGAAGGEGRLAHAIDLTAVAPEMVVETSRFRALSAALSIAVTDGRGHVTWLNERFSRDFGLSPDDVLQKAQSTFVNSAGPDHQITIKTKSGELRPVKSMEAPFDDGAGNGSLRVFAELTAQESGQSGQMDELKAERDGLHSLVASLGKTLAKSNTGDALPLLAQPYPDEHKEICTQFNKLVNLLNVTRSSLARTVEPINLKAGVIESAAQEMAERTESQAATLEQSSTALEQLSGNLRSAAQKTSDIEREIQVAQSSAREGESVVKDAVSAMGEISTSSDEISQIIGLIDDIAFQTNLLALNAGVEAARAGDAGRGFAVVASEVRALAQRSSDAAKQIKDLISKSAQEVSHGVDLVDKTGAVLEGIVNAIDGITARFVEINASAKEQAEGLAEVTTAVSDLDQVTQQNAAMAEENIAVGRELREGIANLAALGSNKSLRPSQDRSPAPSRGRSTPSQPRKNVSPNSRTRASSPATQPRTVKQQQAQAASAAAELVPAAASGDAFDDDWADF